MQSVALLREGVPSMGRKRAIGIAREPNGRAQRHKEYHPTAIRRLLDADMAKVLDANWGTELGRLYLHGKLKTGNHSADSLMAAGQRWANLAHRYQRAIAAPSPQCRSASLQRGEQSTPPDPDSEVGLFLLRGEQKDIEDFMEAHSLLIIAGKLVEATVRAVCERNETIQFGDIEKLNTGLAKLADKFGLTERRGRVK